MVKSFPAEMNSSDDGLWLQAYSSSNQKDLWGSIVSDRENSKRKGIWPGIDSFESLASYMTACDYRDPKSEEFGYLIRAKDGTLLGTMHIFSVDWINGSAEVGYGLHHQYEGKGIATKALLVTEKMLLEMGFQKIKITCQKWNQKSWAVAERSGYTLVKTFHKDLHCIGCDDCTLAYEKALKQ